jgi:beta-glucanase (GH16 family)
MNRIQLFTKRALLRVSTYALLLTSILMLDACTEDAQTVVTLTNLVMSDEFDTPGALNPNLWSYEIGTGQNGWGNNELQYYTNRAENANVQNGFLSITARKEAFSGSQYTSARLITKAKFEQAYGRFETRMRLPWGQGLWPAFWMLGADIDNNPWPGAGEIDIMEYRGQNPTVVLGTVHGPGYSAGQSISKSYELTNDRFDTGFHVFGIEWGPEYINFYVDDVLYNQITPADVPGEWVFNKPFFLLVNLAVGGSFVGSPNNETVFPQTLLVDYVRVYQ